MESHAGLALQVLMPISDLLGFRFIYCLLIFTFKSDTYLISTFTPAQTLLIPTYV